MILRRLFPGGVGRARGGRASPGAWIEFTVSTKQTGPAQSFSTRPPAGGPEFGPYRITAGPVAGPDARRT